MAPRKSNPTILLIDDDAISREVMQLTLEMANLSVASCEEGESAIARLEADSFDLILMDTQMPGLSGLALVRAIRDRTSSRIVAISGSEVGEPMREATNGFLLKPFGAESVLEILSEKIGAGRGGTNDSGGDGNARALSAIPNGQAASKEALRAIDATVLGNLKAMMSAAAVEEIYAAVASDLERRLPFLEAAIESGNGPEVSRIGHAIKGGCAMVGLTEAVEAASNLEKGNHSGTVQEKWRKELLRLRVTLAGLQGILCDRLLK